MARSPLRFDSPSATPQRGLPVCSVADCGRDGSCGRHGVPYCKEHFPDAGFQERRRERLAAKRAGGGS